MLVSVQVRLQLVTGATAYHATNATECGTSMVCNPATYAAAAFGRFDFLLSDTGDFRPFVGGMLGGGTIRHLATFLSEPHCGPSGKDACVDTVASGPVLVGGSGGFLYNLSPSFALLAELNAVLGFTKFTFNVDLAVGAALQF